jgi:hypothetical protein
MPEQASVHPDARRVKNSGKVRDAHSVISAGDDNLGVFPIIAI